MIARVAGDAIGADAFIANMAEDEFLKTLSKGGIEDANRALGIQPRNTGKEMRAALIQHIGQRTFVLPAACFGLTAEEAAQLQERTADDGKGSAEPPDENDDETEAEAGDPLDQSDEQLTGGNEPEDDGQLLRDAVQHARGELPEQRQAA